jgi:hypothetical protein
VTHPASQVAHNADAEAARSAPITGVLCVERHENICADLARMEDGSGASSVCAFWRAPDRHIGDGRLRGGRARWGRAGDLRAGPERSERDRS